MAQNTPESSYVVVSGSSLFLPNEVHPHGTGLIVISEQDMLVIEDWIPTHESPHTHDAYRRDIRELLTSLHKPLAF